MVRRLGRATLVTRTPPVEQADLPEWLNSARRPVTIARGDKGGTSMRNIVVGYDGSDTAKRALDRAAELAPGGATVTVVSAVHVHPPAGRAAGPIDADEVSERRHELAEAEKVLGEKGVKSTLVEGHGDPAEVIVDQAKEIGADLIVVGTRGMTAPARIVLGSVSTKVVHEAPCDVLVVR
jgi:nucleotide-binding universal stress UspA family protein